MPNQVDNQGLVLSADAKPRLKWTQQLHELFVDAVSQLGGEEKATPKSVMRVMGIPGLTLYHLKSHLQKYRLAKNQNLNSFHDSNKQDRMIIGYRGEDRIAHTDENRNQPQFNGTTLQMQMEVQRKLQEHIERHLQLRIEAQGKYLQSVLRKAQETLAGYTINSMGMEAAKTELMELVSAVDSESLSISFSGGSFLPKQPQHADGSMDSCLTSTVSIERKDMKIHKLESSSSSRNWNEESDEINPSSNSRIETLSSDQFGGRKRSCSSIYEEACIEKPTIGKRLHEKEHSFGKPEELDLNR